MPRQYVGTRTSVPPASGRSRHAEQLDLARADEAPQRLGQLVVAVRRVELAYSHLVAPTALGVSMSGARLVLHVAYELHRRGAGTGAAALCGGGGQGDALVLTAGA